MTDDLPNAGEPLVLRDGTRIDPKTGRAQSKTASIIALPSARDAVNIVSRARRRLADLPAPPRASNALSVVLTYTQLGLGDEDIAIACSITVEQVVNMRALSAYKELERAVTKAILEQDADDVRTYIAQHARTAAQRVVEATNDADGAIALRASMDVLDRAGHRPADVVEHRHKLEGGLTINIIEKASDADIPQVPMDNGA